MSVPESDFKESRAVLAPTLEATASILPLLAKPREPRFPPAKTAIWEAGWSALKLAWNDRHGRGFAALRPAVFQLCAAALELKDGDCLALSEALATATDRLDEPEGLSLAHLSAAITATIECLAEEAALEHAAFPQRARYFASRLERAADKREALPRSPVLDRLFAEDARECLERMRGACAALPPDPHGLKAAAADLARVAEALDLSAIALTAGRLVRMMTVRAGEHVDLDEPETRDSTLALISEIGEQLAAMPT